MFNKKANKHNLGNNVVMKQWQDKNELKQQKKKKLNLTLRKHKI